MAGLSPTSVKTYIAGAAVTKRRIVKLGAADGAVVMSAGAASTEFHIGVSTEIDSASGEPCDVIRDGFADVEFGGTVVRGAPVTSDSTGRAVSASPSAGVNHRIIGFAEVSSLIGDVGTIFINPGLMQG